MMYDLEKLRKTTKIKLVFMSISIAIPIIIILIMAPLSRKYFSEYVNLPIKVLRYVVLGLGEVFVILKLVYYICILSSEDIAKKVLVRKNDERIIFINQKIGVFSLKMLFYLLIIGIVISGFLNTIVFITLCGVVGALLLTTLFTALYYNKKY